MRLELRKTSVFFLTAAAVCAALAAGVLAQSEGPRIVTLTGKVIDITCSVKHKEMRDSWHNAENNKHKTPEGLKPKCAAMCLRGGQPAGLFANDRVEALLACNPRMTLADYAAEEVELRGFWAGGKYDKARSFVPQQIRRLGESEWADVDCLTMHNQ